MTDPIRLNLPSASSFALDALCPGRQALLNSIGDIPEPVDHDAMHGSALHMAWEVESTLGLMQEDVELYEEGLRLAKVAYMQWVMAFDVKNAVEGQREYRFWLHGQNGELAASGQADRHWFTKERGLLLDYKALWCSSLVPSELNWQLLFLAVCCAREYDLPHVRCAFVKPMFRQLDVVDYGPEDLERAQCAIQQVLWQSKHLLERRPGPHCRHCKAATACPEAKSYCLLPSVQSNALEGIKPKDATAIVERLNLHDCVKIWATQTSRRNIEDAIKVRLKALPPEVQTELGIKLGEPKITRSITDARNAFEFLESVGVPADKLWQAIKISNERLADVVQESLGKTSQKAAVAWIREKLAPFITEEEQDKPLQKIW
jgi:hypothetical protein